MKAHILRALQSEKESILIREKLLEEFVKNGGISPTSEYSMSLSEDELDIWVRPEEYFSAIELAIIKRIEEEGSEALWKNIDVKKLETALAIARSWKVTPVKDAA
jgi:regulator of sigma D